jgi:hypothetical protein
MSLYGLKEFSSQQQETLEMLDVLVPLVAGFSGTFNTQNVAGSLQGLQKLRSGPKSVDSLVGALAPLVATANG